MHLDRFQSGRQIALEEIFGRNPTLAVGARGPELHAEDDRQSRVLCGGIGVGHRATHRAAIADLRMSHQLGRSQQNRLQTAHQLGLFDGAFAGHGSDRQASVLLADVLQLVDRVEIDQELGARHPHAQQRHQALAAGEKLDVLVPVLLEQGDRLVQGAGSGVFEGSGFHASAFSGCEPAPSI